MSIKLQSISLPDKRPRDAMQLKKKIPLHRGLTPYYFFGVFTLSVPFIPAILLAVNGMISQIGWLPLLLLFLMAETSAFLFLNFANKNYLRRLRAFTNGFPIKAKVIAYQRNFIFWKASFEHKFVLSYEYKGKRLESSFNAAFADLQSQFPVQSELTGLFDPDSGSICFPPEIGLVLETKPENINPRKK